MALLVIEQTMAVAGRFASRFLFAGGADLAADPGLFDCCLGVVQARPTLARPGDRAMPAAVTAPSPP